MKNLYFSILFAFAVSQTFSQIRPAAKWPKNQQGKYRCFTDEMDAWRKGVSNSIHSKTAFENWIKNQEEQLGKQQTAQRNAQIVYNIPVIFHIIHNGDAVGTGSNIAKLYVDGSEEHTS